MALPDESLVPDIDGPKLHRYMQLLNQRKSIDKKISILIKDCAMVPRPKWGPCTRCGHSWYGMYPRRKPVCCAGCGTTYWQKPYVSKATKQQGQRIREIRSSTEPPPVSEKTSLENWLEAVYRETVRRPLQTDGPLITPFDRGSIKMTPPPPPVEPVMVLPRREAPTPETFVTRNHEEETSAKPKPDDVHSEQPPLAEEVSAPPALPDDGSRCCGSPLIVEGFCVSCGAGLEVPQKELGHGDDTR